MDSALTIFLMASTKKAKAALEESLPERLARLRRERGITQAELAEQVGTIQPIVSDYERGRCRPNPVILVKMARVLECSTDELLGLTTTTRVDTSISRRWAKRLRDIDSLSKRDQDALLRTIDAFLVKAKAEEPGTSSRRG